MPCRGRRSHGPRRAGNVKVVVTGQRVGSRLAVAVLSAPATPLLPSHRSLCGCNMRFRSASYARYGHHLQRSCAVRSLGLFRRVQPHRAWGLVRRGHAGRVDLLGQKTGAQVLQFPWRALPHQVEGGGFSGLPQYRPVRRKSVRANEHGDLYFLLCGSKVWLNSQPLTEPFCSNCCCFCTINHFRCSDTLQKCLGVCFVRYFGLATTILPKWTKTDLSPQRLPEQVKSWFFTHREAASALFPLHVVSSCNSQYCVTKSQKTFMPPKTPDWKTIFWKCVFHDVLSTFFGPENCFKNSHKDLPV